jgi:glycosyltransferase involved in cell wall biosynthesis
MVKSNEKQIKLLFFGYPSSLKNYTGGFLWMKKVADLIDKSGCYSVLKIYNHNTAKKIPNKIMADTYNALTALAKWPDIAILDSWGESNIVLWLLLRLFKPKTKIFVVFHHHEPRISICRNYFELLYNYMIQKATAVMLKDSDIILTVSQASKHELMTVYGIGVSKINNLKETANKKTRDLAKNLTNRIAIVGTGIDKNIFLKDSNKLIDNKRDIDFLCIGRIEKFHGLKEIWMAIKKLRPDANLVMAGRITPDEAAELRNAGIDHRGFVSEEEKISLYSKSKVFIFPSSREGFGIAVAEALFAGVTTVAWKLPVFEELYLKNGYTNIKLIEYGDTKLFAEECVKMLNKYGTGKKTTEGKKVIFQFPNWQTVAKNVMATIESIE